VCHHISTGVYLLYLDFSPLVLLVHAI